MQSISSSLSFIIPPTVGKGAINVAFVCPSVCSSVEYIANNFWEPKGLACPNLERRFPILDAIRIPVSRTKVRVTRPINADTKSAPYLPNGKAYELQAWYTDGGRRPASATSAMTSKIKGQGHKLTSTVRLISASS